MPLKLIKEYRRAAASPSASFREKEPLKLSAGGNQTSVAHLRCRGTGAGSSIFDHFGKHLVYGPPSQRRIVVEIADELAAQSPNVIDVFLDRLW